MQFRILLPLIAAGACLAAGPVEFRPHVVEPKIPGGYGVMAIDMNKDGKPDLVPVTSRIQELAWYENPTWERHVMIDGTPGLVNFAAADIDGDGIPEIAYESSFAMVPAKSEGLVWVMHHQGDPRQRWKEQKVDALTTSHHVVWADLDGDGKKELINAPLLGPLGLAPTYDQDKVPLVWYRLNEWKRYVVPHDIQGIIHRVRAVKWENGRRDQLLTASFEGITLYKASGSGANLKWDVKVLAKGHSEDKAPRLGSSDVAVARNKGKRFLAAVEPWHGNEIVIYNEDKAGNWERQVLFSGIVEGHEVAVGDFNGDGRDDIVAGDRGKGATVHVMYAPETAAGKWEHQPLDAGGMSASGCVTADINGDKRIDVVCVGGQTANLKWYENLGPAGGKATSSGR